MKLKDYKYILLTLFIVISLTMRIYAVNDSVSMIVDTLSLKSPQLVSTEQPDSLSPLIYILPKTPQASALSRYGEIPVNLSTGVPNISIPLYNIKAGNYTLPISISYHASGIKTDDVATCVGLGWVLNAGGAITRTVRGLPDLKNGDMNQDTLYWSYKRCYEASKNIDEVSNIIAMDIDHPQMHDTESDRYIYNFADKTGVFVYSLADKAFVPLNYQPFLIYAEGGENSSFSIADTDGTEYFFTQQEKTGFADDEGQIGVSAWYLTRIHAEGGDINIRYNEFEPFYMYTVSQSIEVGERVIWNEASNNPDQTIISVGTLQTSKPRKYKYSQVFPIEITWNGNRISFEYLNDREDPGITRLVKMSVSNNLGETVKTVDFNVCYVGGKLIENGSIYTNKRMLLESVDLSDEGKYSFTYNRNTNLPYYELHGKASELHASKDYWGYYNGYKKGCGIPLGVVKDAYLCYTTSSFWHQKFDYYEIEDSRYPSLEYAQMLILKGIASIKTSNGYEILYKYDEAARLKQMEDHNGIYEQYEYSVRNSYKVKHGTNSVKTTRWLDEKGHNLLSKYIVYDRFGRPFDEATNGVNESGKYVHTFSTYDNKNRVYRKWLPVVGTTAFSEPTEGEIIDLSRSTYGEDNTCNTMTYDAIDSPVFQTTAGCDWKGKGKATKYVSNTESDVRLFHASMTKNSLVDDGFYLPNMLSGEKHTDEDGHSITVFKDKLGRKVLERRSNGMNNNDTYFVYNGLGQLRYVLSPEYQKAGYKDMYAYEYRYDERGNIVKKILPGCEYVQYWYDRGNRLTFVQDATLRERGLYRFLLYDKLGRLAVQGTCKTCSRGEQPNIVEFEKNNTGICNTGYKITLSDKITNPNLEVVNYYDDYSFITRYTDVAGAVSSDMKTEASCATGLQTGSLQVASNGDRILTATYYDKKGQVADIRKLYVDKRFTHIHTAYSYTGNPISIDLKEYAIGDNGKTLTVSQNQTNVYSDKTDKLISVTVTINGKTSTVQKLEYSDLGRIKSITRGGNAGTIVYSYNIHGWQTSISSRDFSEELHYTDGAGTPCYNGNISSLQWTASDYDQKRGCKFTYDALDRLTEAVYGERDNFEDKLNRYNEKVIEYSENGAIKRFQRRGLKDDGVYGKIDNLHVYYNGNRLKRVVDDALPVNRYSSSSFIDGVDDDIEYTYNGVGALTSDKNRGITNIEYDNWNTPATIAFKDGTSISYCYLPDGTKLNSGYTFMSGCVCIDKGLVEYSSNIIYRNGKLSEVLLPNGYCTFDKGNTPVFHYFTCDHLGNNRTVVNENGTVEQIVHYYPFGGIFNDSGLNVELQHYKYNGKELDMTGGLNTYDYGARQYFSPLPVWDRMDEKCEEDYNVSPYVYCRDNPIFFFDDNGKDGIAYVIGDDISIYVNILFWGKGATEKNIKIIKNDINRLWNKEWKYYSLDTQKEYNVSFNVNVGIFYDTFEEPNEKNSDVFDSESNNNYIELFNSTPDDKTSITIGGKRGRWRSEGLSNNNVNDDPAPHEFGHLLGLKDKYFVDKNNVAHEYDGYVGDIMATPYPNGNVQQKEINGILDQIKFTIDYEQIYKIHFNNPHDF